MRTIKTFAPSDGLGEYIAHYLLRSDQFGEQVVVMPITASPNVMLVLNFEETAEAYEYCTGKTRTMPTTFVVGPQTGRRAEVFLRGNSAGLIVQFKPAGFHRLFHASVEPLTDTAVSAGELLGGEIEPLPLRLRYARSDAQRIALIESFLRSRVASARPRHPVADAAVAILNANGAVRVSALAKASGLSARQFERAFHEQMGMSPKLFARAARLDFALQLKRVNPGHTWARVSQEAGYFDQTHFVKDFKSLAGETPSTFPLVDRVVPAISRRPA